MTLPPDARIPMLDVDDARGAGRHHLLVVPHHGGAWLGDAGPWSMEPCGACCGQALRLALAAPRRHIDGTIRFRCSDRGMGDDRSWPATLYHIWIIAHCRFRVSARSEEHTSELQSLMRISYAVF